MENTLTAGNTVTFPQDANAQAIRSAVLKALADEDFMGSIKKINAAVEALTPKDDVSRVFNQLLGNARKDFNDKKERGLIGYTEDDRAEKTKEYVQSRFKKHMADPKTGLKATRLFNAEYLPKADASAPEEAAAAESED